MPDVRPVWLTRETAFVHGLEDAWDAAPADAPLVVELARKAWHADVRAEQGENAAVLRALGMPDA